MAPPSGNTTSVQVAVRIRPTTSHDTISIPARFQRTVVQAASATTVQVDSAQSAPGNPAPNSPSQPSSSNSNQSKKQFFTFDQVHPPSTSQHALFQTTAEPLISRFLQGFNCTILAYGQTSSGKTYSMTGVDLDADPSDPDNGMGIIPRSLSKIFERARQIKEERGVGWTYTLKGSFIEIYNEDLIDLLADEAIKREVQIREDKDGNIIWNGLREVSVRNVNEVMSLIKQGTSIRRTNETDMNSQSSRSHAIFSLTLTQKKFTGSGLPPRSSSPLPPGRSPSRLGRPGSQYNTSSLPRVNSPTGRPPTPSFHAAMSRVGGNRPGSSLGGRISPAPGKDKDDDEIGEWVTIVSKFNFVDLAGSERLKRTAAVGERIKEGISINSGLLALGNVISALGDPSRAKSHTASHIPYRDSKLTRLLQDSLGGNSNTLMIACVSPAEWNVAETVNTLKYANRARNIRNRAVINEKEDGWDDVEWLQNMVTRLRRDLKALKDGVNPSEESDNAHNDFEQEGSNRIALQQFVELQSQHDELRRQFTQRTEELTRLRRELGESQRAIGGSIPGTGKYEEIVGPVIEEYEKTIASMEAELNLNRTALRHTNNLLSEKEEELTMTAERHAVTESYLEELRARVMKLSDREASTEAYIRDLEEKIKVYEEKTSSSSSVVADLRREIQQCRDAESHSVAYIVDLEQRLSRNDETVLSLRERVQQLEYDVEVRAEVAETLQKRLEEITSDGAAWRADLEDREAKLKELEKQLEMWEEKRKSANEDRERLGDVAEDVAKARRSLEIDLQSTSDKENDLHGSLNTEEQLTSLRETHQATLADLTNVTDKYRDALREISDLASQIQELKLQASSQREPSDDGSDVPSTPRRRLTTGSGLRSPRSDGRRSFFRQAASTESLHARSLSQSQSLSQELSSARLSKHSLNGRPDSLTIPNTARLSTISRSASYSPLLDSPSTERSVASLEKEIMRLQEVLKEREAEISTLEESLKEKATGASTLVQDIPPIPEVDDVESEISDPSLSELSPATLQQFKDLRRLSKRLSLQKLPELTPNPSETLDRLNELMLSMAQKESHHREVVDGINAELSQVRRQYEELSTLSRNQALNMSTELEALRKDHLATASELEELQLKHAEVTTELENQLVSQENLKAGLEGLRQREMELLEQLRLVEQSHAEAMEKTQSDHEKALQEKANEHLQVIDDLRSAHKNEESRLREHVAATEASLSRKEQEYEDNFARLRTQQAEELERHSKEIETFLGQSRTEQAETLSRLQGEHALALKKEIESTQTRIQEIRDEHASMLARLQEEHETFLSQKEEEHQKTVKALQAKHESDLESVETRTSETLRTLRLEYSNEIQALEEKHTKALADQEEFSQNVLNKFRQDQEMLHAELTQAHETSAKTLQDEHAIVIAKLNEVISRLSQDNENIRRELGDALAEKQENISERLDIAKKAHETAIEILQKEHVDALHKLVSEHETSLAAIASAHATEKDLENRRLKDELAQLTAEHEQALSEVQLTLESVKAEHQKALEEHQRSSEELLAQTADEHAAAVEELTKVHRQERETLLEEHDALVQEVASYKAAMDEFAATREQTREAHGETLVKKDLHIAALEEEVSILKQKRAELASTIEQLRADLETTKVQTSELVQEASKRESLVHDLERHRSLLGDLQINLQKTRDERDTLAAEKSKQDDMLRHLQNQLEVQSIKAESPVSPRPIPEHRAGSLSRINGIPPPMTPPPAGPPPPTPNQLPRAATDGVGTRSSATMSTATRSSQLDNSTTPTSPILNGSSLGGDPKLLSRLEEHTRLLEEKETMIKTLNKQLTHCEGDLQAHMDLVSTLETQLSDSERNLRKARLQASEFSKERDRLAGQVESLRNEVQDAKREVANVRRSVVEEKQSLENRLEEERKAKERARAQLDARMEDIHKRRSKFVCM